MLISKRGGNVLTRSPHKNRRASISGETTESLISGDTVLFACSGIAIERQGYITKFLTSASLVKAFNGTDRTAKRRGNLKIEVRHEGTVVMGRFGEYSLDHNFAFVNIMTSLDVHVGHLKHAVEILPHHRVVAAGRDISGEVRTTSVTLTGDSSGFEDREELMLSTSKNPEAWEGGPLFDFDGNFVGMNLSFVSVLPRGTILERLEHFRTSLQKKNLLQRFKLLKPDRVGERPICELSNSQPIVHRNVLYKDQFGDRDHGLSQAI